MIIMMMIMLSCSQDRLYGSMPVFTQWSKIGSSPSKGDTVPINVKFGTGSTPMSNIVRIAEDSRPLRANLYQKFQILTIFDDFSPHFYSYTDEIWCEGADLGLLCPRQIL